MSSQPRIEYEETNDRNPKKRFRYALISIDFDPILIQKIKNKK